MPCICTSSVAGTLSPWSVPELAGWIHCHFTSHTQKDIRMEVSPKGDRGPTIQGFYLVNGMRVGGLSVRHFARGIWVDIANVRDVVDRDAPE